MKYFFFNGHLGDRSVSLHEALPLAVDQVAALSPAALSNQAASAIDPSGVELNKLHVLQVGGHQYHRVPLTASVGRFFVKWKEA